MAGLVRDVERRDGRRGARPRPASPPSARRGCRTRSKRRARGARSGSRSRSAAISEASSSRRRSAGTGGGQPGAGRVEPDLGDEAQARQEPGPALGQEVEEAPPHPPGGQPDGDAAPGLGRGARQPRREAARRARASPSAPGGRPKTRGPGPSKQAGLRHRPPRPASVARRGRGSRAGPRRTSAPGQTRPKQRRRAPPSRPRARLSEKTVVGDRGEAVGPDDLGAGVDEVGPAPARAGGPSASRSKSPAPPVAHGPARAGRGGAAPPSRAARRAARWRSGFGPAQAASLLSVQTGPGPSSGSAARRPPPVSSRRVGLVGDQDAAPGEVGAELVGPVVDVDHGAGRRRLLHEVERRGRSGSGPRPRSAASAGRR